VARLLKKHTTQIRQVIPFASCSESPMMLSPEQTTTHNWTASHWIALFAHRSNCLIPSVVILSGKQVRATLEIFSQMNHRKFLRILSGFKQVSVPWSFCLGEFPFHDLFISVPVWNTAFN